MEVTAPKGPSVVFPCRCWLAEDEDDGQTTRVLVPGQSLTSQYDSKHGKFYFLTLLRVAFDQVPDWVIE